MKFIKQKLRITEIEKKSKLKEKKYRKKAPNLLEELFVFDISSNHGINCN
jgi:hypothetical protein